MKKHIALIAIALASLATAQGATCKPPKKMAGGLLPVPAPLTYDCKMSANRPSRVKWYEAWTAPLGSEAIKQTPNKIISAFKKAGYTVESAKKDKLITVVFVKGDKLVSLMIGANESRKLAYFVLAGL